LITLFADSCTQKRSRIQLNAGHGKPEKLIKFGQEVRENKDFCLDLCLCVCVCELVHT